MDEGSAQVESRQLKVAIIGGGLAGLAAAVTLMDNAEVTIFEKSNGLGGRALTAHKEGYDINQGPHALYIGGYAHKFLDELKLLPTGASPNISGGKAYYKKRLATLPTTLSSLLSTGMLSLIEKWQLANIFKRLAKIDTEALKGKTVSEWLDSDVRSPAVKETIAAFIRLSSYCNNPDMMSAGAAFAQMNLSSQGVLYLDHGWETMVKALAERTTEKVQFKIGVEVKELQRFGDDTGIHVCTSEEDEVKSKLFDAVIFAVPPHSVAQILRQYDPHDCFADALAQMDAIEVTRAACLDVCLKTLPIASTTFALGIDEPLYFSVHSTSAKLAPPGGALVHAAYYLEAGRTGGVEHRKRLEQYLEEIQPGWRDQVVYERFMPNMVASFGCATASNGGHQGIAGPLLKGAKNIYACGDWVGSGHMLVDAAVSSAVEAATMILTSNKIMAHSR
ncbi:MAG: FAD-dependent oxidoreductase [Candidatus Obscuribacterales bacterium]|nr:FAD-dependent oxidoreductase [Candidatus Obscuribacterales bacterium]